MIGIRRSFLRTSNLVITSSAALQTAGLASPIAANQTQTLRYFLPITVGATGGVRLQVAVPAAGTAFVAGIYLANTVAPSVTNAVQTSSAAFTNALANAGNHFIVVDVTVVNGATAGDVDLQIAQNTSDALSLTLLRGASVEVVAS
jgi:hypothetical protein